MHTPSPPFVPLPASPLSLMEKDQPSSFPPSGIPVPFRVPPLPIESLGWCEEKRARGSHALSVRSLVQKHEATGEDLQKRKRNVTVPRRGNSFFFSLLETGASDEKRLSQPGRIALFISEFPAAGPFSLLGISTELIPPCSNIQTTLKGNSCIRKVF